MPGKVVPRRKSHQSLVIKNAGTKFVPLSEYKAIIGPLRAVNLRSALTNESVSSVLIFSR